LVSFECTDLDQVGNATNRPQQRLRRVGEAEAEE
jgi:hypothetical protein